MKTLNRLQEVSVVIPVLNDAKRLANLLDDLRPHPLGEVIVVDGGSSDHLDIVLDSETLVASRPGRGTQIRVGFNQATKPWIWVLHADSRIDQSLPEQLVKELHGTRWGSFNIRFASTHWLLRLVALSINLRSRVVRICTGDQGLFFHKDLIHQIDGFPEQPLLEDIEVCRRLKRISKPIRVKAYIEADARRWMKNGIIRTIFQMWLIRLLYFLGVSADRLSRMYYRS